MKESWVCIIRIKTNEGFRSHMVEKTSFTIGRTQDADLPILAPSVSRLHLSIEIKKDAIWIVDQRSANGTFVNGQKVDAGEMIALRPEDVVKLGTATGEFQFMSIPRPFELHDEALQRSILSHSMEEIAKEIEVKTRDQAEKGVSEAKLAAEQLLSHAKRDLEIMRTQGAMELQERKTQVEAELQTLRQTAQSEASQERLRARREADLIVADAQKRIQKDYEAASERMEAQLKQAQDQAMATLHEAETRARSILSQASEEASGVRFESAEDARKIHQEALRKSADSLKERQELAQKEIASKREEVLAAARLEIEREKERYQRDTASQRERLESEFHSLTQSNSNLKTEVARLEESRAKTQTEYSKIKEQFEKATELLATVADLESRREQSEKAIKTMELERVNGRAAIEAEFKELRDLGTVENESRKRDLENELAKTRLKAMEDLQRKITLEEERYEQTMRLRAIEISQKISEVVLPEIGQLPEDVDQARTHLKNIIDNTVTQTLLSNVSAIQVNATDLTEKPKENTEEKSKKKRKYYVAAAAAIIVGLVIYGEELYKLALDMQQKSYASEMIERRRVQSIYTPEQSEEFRGTYTDNVLFMKGYLETKSDSVYVERWTLRLNDLGLIQPMGLSEENIVQFIAKETNLIQRLGALRSSIDAVYLEEGINRLRAAEDETMAEIKVILKGEENYKKIREIEKEFLLKYEKTPVF